MLYVFGFERVCVALSDLYVVDPDATADRLGDERGVRLEVRAIAKTTWRGSKYATQTIQLGEPIWRVDFLETLDHPRSLNRVHHHPQFDDWEPCADVWDEQLSGDPIGYLAHGLADLDGLFDRVSADRSLAAPEDAAQLRTAIPEITATLDRLLTKVSEGELAPPRHVPDGVNVRDSWL